MRNTARVGEKLAEGKTKIVFADPTNEYSAILRHKEDITAGDGEKHDFLKDKDIYSNQTTRNVFRLLRNHDIPNHFMSKISPNEMLVRRCDMVPLEVVVRRIATGSYLQRHPGVEEGFIFKELPVEFFLKDDSRHDPLVIYDGLFEKILLYDAHSKFDSNTPVGRLGAIKTQLGKFVDVGVDFRKMREIAKKVFEVLESVWKAQNIDLVDLKIEFGFWVDHQLMVADVIDNDSWRIWPKGKKEKMLDKQVYRNGTADLDVIKKNYALVAAMTDKFVN